MKFKEYFGSASSDIKKTCIICQNYDMPLFAENAVNGFFVKSADAGNATVIALKNNFLAGDTVLYLKETKCKNIILFGSCGGCGNVASGDMLMIDKAYNYESFSNMLAFDKTSGFVSSSDQLTRSFYAKNRYGELIKTNSACVSSLLLETKYINFFKENDICAVDMESSIVFSAAADIKASVLCLMYVADHIENNPVGEKLAQRAKKKISSARKELARMILRFADEL